MPRAKKTKEVVEVEETKEEEVEAVEEESVEETKEVVEETTMKEPKNVMTKDGEFVVIDAAKEKDWKKKYLHRSGSKLDD